MKMRKKITFFMIVTNRDIFIADYAIKSYKRLYDRYKETIPFVLKVYANCLDGSVKSRHFTLWKQLPFVDIIDNSVNVDTTRLVPGEKIMSPEGTETVREGAYEHCDEIWTNELRKITTPYFATVDADFEILNPDFVYHMIKTLDDNPKVIGMSTDHNADRFHCFDKYRNQYINLHARWSTWFCIYKKAANECTASHFYFEETRPDGEVMVYDSAGYFQKRLQIDFGYEFLHIEPKYRSQFIHYGAFSKNSSIGYHNIRLYRYLSILSANGLFFFTAFGIESSIANRIVKWTVKKLQKRIFHDTERMQFTFTKK